MPGLRRATPVTRPLAPLLAALATLATPVAARAQDCAVEPRAVSYTRILAGPQVSDGPHEGRPATSVQANTWQGSSGTAAASAATTVDSGGFVARSETSADLLISPTASNYAGAETNGDVFDCLRIDGHAGSARLHVPIALTGGTAVSWTIGGAYVPPEGYRSAAATLTILCAANAGAQILPCDDPVRIWDVGGPIDETLELVIPFTFGVPFAFQYGPRLATAVGYAANGQGGVLSGIVSVELRGELLPAVVRDLGGTEIAVSTISAASGFDFRNPVPEPRGGAALVTAAALAALRARSTQPTRPT